MEIVFFGTPEFAVPSLRALLGSRHRVKLVVAQPDRPAGRGMKLRKPAVAELALAKSIPLVQPAKIRTEEFLRTVEEASPDAAVVVAYGRILPAALLAIPRHGCINVHGSVLPKYRGAAPIQRAIQHGERTTGVTIMRLDEEMDHGPVFATRETPIGFEERTPGLAARLAAMGGELLIEVLDALEEGTAVAREQNHDEATYAPKIEKEEGAVDWAEPGLAIYDRYRAFDPWPGVFVSIRGEVVKLLDLVPVVPKASAAPGTVLEIGPAGVTVATGSGAIRIRRMQRAGKGAVDAADLARGWSLAAGDLLR